MQWFACLLFTGSLFNSQQQVLRACCYRQCCCCWGANKSCGWSWESDIWRERKSFVEGAASACCCCTAGLHPWLCRAEAGEPFSDATRATDFMLSHNTSVYLAFALVVLSASEGKKGGRDGTNFMDFEAWEKKKIQMLKVKSKAKPSRVRKWETWDWTEESMYVRLT